MAAYSRRVVDNIWRGVVTSVRMTTPSLAKRRRLLIEMYNVHV